MCTHIAPGFVIELFHTLKGIIVRCAPVLRIRIRIRIHRIHMFLGLLDPDLDPLVRGMDPDPDPTLDPDPDPSIIMQK
jgi:hypothetical protein